MTQCPHGFVSPIFCKECHCPDCNNTGKVLDIRNQVHACHCQITKERCNTGVEKVEGTPIVKVRYPVSEYDQLKGFTNFEITKHGVIKRVGYSTLRGFIKMIKSQNKSLKKLGCKVTFTIELPIRE